MSHVYPPSRQRSAFTLVELLVTVGIIAVLVSILVPAISLARGHANEVRCLANQRSLIQAMLLYAADNAGYLPPPNWDGAAKNAPTGWLYNPNALVPSGTFHQTDSTTGALYPYLNNIEVFRCNVDDGNWGSNTVQVVTSYMMNGALCDFGLKGSSYGDKLRAFKSNAILLWEIPVDDPNDSGQVNDGADAPSEGITTRHSNGSTVGFVDGHAELMTWAAFVNEWYYHPAGKLWCAPRFADGGFSEYFDGSTPARKFPATPPAQPTNGG
jgi:prepilin-type processing-associated H-X9-DG protein/prepilin-type N-terminal cleavage/methylation domain-containing protein